MGLSSPAFHELEQIIDCHSVNKQIRGESGCWRSGPPVNEPTQVSETLRRFSQHAHSPKSVHDIISYLYRPLSIYPCSLESHGTVPSDLRAHSPPLLPFVQVSKPVTATPASPGFHQSYPTAASYFNLLRGPMYTTTRWYLPTYPAS